MSVKIQSQSLAQDVQNTSMPSGVEKHSTMYGSRHILSPQCAFKSLMIHEVLRFALRIAFCCVLHQCKNLDIHCWNLLQWLDKLIIRSTSFKKWVASSKKDWTRSPTSKKCFPSSKKGWTHSPTSKKWIAFSENDGQAKIHFGWELVRFEVPFKVL